MTVLSSIIRPVVLSALALGVSLLGAGCASTTPVTRSMTQHVIEQAELAHGKSVYQAQADMAAHVKIAMPGKTIVDADFRFQAHGDKSRMVSDDGAKTVIHTGSDCYVSPADGATPSDRFHVWTWPWFIIAPFKLQGDGISLSDYRVIEMDGIAYHTVKQTFASGEGDAPDDWYRLFFHPDTKRLDAMVYIVTFGKDAEEVNASDKYSIILYRDYQDVDGALVAGRYEFWYWDPTTDSRMGDSPKFRGEVTDIRFLPDAPAAYVPPAGAATVDVPAPTAE